MPNINHSTELNARNFARTKKTSSFDEKRQVATMTPETEDTNLRSIQEDSIYKISESDDIMLSRENECNSNMGQLKVA